MLSTILSVILITYLPGAMVFRYPGARRERRAALPVEERVFWYVVISLSISSVAALGLAAIGGYRLLFLLLINGALCAVLGITGRTQLRLPSTTRRVGWTAVVPAVIVGVVVWIIFYVPPAEYLMGGKDPGTYMNEGIQIAQRGTLTVSDPVVASLPSEFRSLFFRESDDPTYHTNRFMGFFLLDPDAGEVVGQFPHLYPTWIAIGYGINGLTGARYVVGLWAALGVLAVYFAGAWLLGRPAAILGALLLAVHVGQIWYGRYPNAEILLQGFLFAGLLAFSRASVDDDRFFAPLAAALATIGFLTHITGLFAIVALGAASVLGTLDGRRPQAAFLVPLVVGTGVAALYYATTLTPYVVLPLGLFRYLPGPPAAPIVLTLVTIASVLWIAKRERARSALRRLVPWLFVVALLGLAAYAYFFRAAALGLADHDAEALRLFTEFYLSPTGLIAALTGLVVVVHRSFWPGLAYMLMLGISSCFFFYKMRVIPEHFWALRRFIPVILPAALLMIGAAAVLPSYLRVWTRLQAPGRVLLYGLGIVVVSAVGQQYVASTRAIVNHVEYAGLIPRIETLAAGVDDMDLLLVESRGASDAHTLALPLAYIYARNVLVFFETNPDKDILRDFLVWARSRYKRVLFIGGGGARVLSRSIHAEPLTLERYQIPEYESAYRAYPREVRYKEFSFGVYALLPQLKLPTRFELDVGATDDLFVLRFHDKETHGGTDTTFRWTQAHSTIALPNASPEVTTLTLWLNDGGRPSTLPPARINVSLDGIPLGAVTATSTFGPHQFKIRPWLARLIGTGEDASQLQLESTTWNPGEELGVDDNRDVGVMVDRITLEP